MRLSSGVGAIWATSPASFSVGDSTVWFLVGTSASGEKSEAANVCSESGPRWPPLQTTHPSALAAALAKSC